MRSWRDKRLTRMMSLRQLRHVPYVARKAVLPLIILLGLVGCSLPSGGVSTYRNDNQLMSFPIPPQWHANGSEWAPGGLPCEYIVVVLPPNESADNSHANTTNISISVFNTAMCSFPHIQTNQYFHREAGSIMIAGTQARLYDNDSSTLDQRAADITCGARQYVITASAPPNQSHQVFGYYLSTLRGFQTSAGACTAS
jgi:hypothetical protein